MKRRLLVACLLIACMAGCYPEDFDYQTWGPEPELELSAPGVTLQPAEGSSETVVVTTNYKEWKATVAEDGQSWCSVEQQENNLVIRVKENAQEKERTTVITVTVGKSKTETKEIAVTQLGTAPKIVMDASTLSFGLDGGTQTVKVTSNVSNWTPAVSVGGDWLKVQGKDGKLVVEAEAYSGKEMREGLVTVSGGAGDATAVATLKVVQMGTDPVLTVSDISAFGTEAGSQTLDVITNRETWSAVVPSTASWLKARRSGDRLTLTVEANEGRAGRECEVLVTAGSGDAMLRYNLLVVQLGEEAELILSASEVRFDGSASMQAVNVFTNCEWEASTDAAWCTLLPGEHTLTLYAEANPSETEIRRGTVIVTAEGLTERLQLVQLPDISLVLSRDSLFMAAAGESRSVTVMTNQEYWEASVPDSIDWCAAIVNGNQLEVAVLPNTGTPRTVAVTVTAGIGEATKSISLVVSQEGTAAPQSDRDILIAFYEATGGDNWTNNTNWCTDKPLSEWYGVTTEMVEPLTKAGEAEERVTQLMLSGEYSGSVYTGNNLTGTLPDVIGGLTELTYLDLSYNPLTGELPAELGNLTKLRSLYIQNTQLTGEIPPELGNLAELRTLWLYYNNLTGDIPPELGKLVNLERLVLSYNQLTGSIPSELGNLTKLQDVTLSENRLTGEIPSTLGNLTALTDLYLETNQLSGSIPPELGNLVNLEYLDLRDNNLTGSIPSELCNLINPYYIWVSGNRLTGYVPKGFTEFPRWNLFKPEQAIFPQQNGVYLEIEPSEEKDTYTVQLLLTGEVGEVYQGTGGHLYGVQVLSRAAGSADEYMPYGYGVYDDSTQVAVELPRDREYTIYTTFVAEGQAKVQPQGALYAKPFEVADYEVRQRGVTPLPDYDGDLPGSPALNAFVQDGVQGLNGIHLGETTLAADGLTYERPNTARYFGERLNYRPAGDGVLEISMARTLFTVTCEVDSLREGAVRIEIEGAPALRIDARAEEHAVSDVFTLANRNGGWTDAGYSETLTVKFIWEKTNGLERELSAERVTFERGKAYRLHTVFKDDGMSMDIENKPLTDGEVIDIEGIIW